MALQAKLDSEKQTGEIFRITVPPHLLPVRARIEQTLNSRAWHPVRPLRDRARQKKLGYLCLVAIIALILAAVLPFSWLTLVLATFGLIVSKKVQPSSKLPSNSLCLAR